MSVWLMTQEYIEKIEAIEKQYYQSGASLNVSSSLSKGEQMTINNGVARIPIKGVLVPKRSAMLDYFNIEHTAYSDIVQNIETADKNARSYVFDIDSQGGNINGLFAAMNAIKAITKPTRAEGSMMVSAAYMLASQTNEILASDELSIFGSIGVATTVYKSTYKKELSNTDSPNKRPDTETEDGISAVRAELDDIFNVLIPRIAEGRGVSESVARNDFGKGAIMTAVTAKSKGLIDGYIKTNSAAKAQVENKKGAKMDLETLKAEHPALFDAVFQSGKKAGQEEERKRVNAHLKLAETTGANDIAFKAIQEGAGLDVELQAAYLSAGIKKQQISARAEDNVPDLTTDEKSKADEAGAKQKLCADTGIEWE